MNARIGVPSASSGQALRLLAALVTQDDKRKDEEKAVQQGAGLPEHIGAER